MVNVFVVRRQLTGLWPIVVRIGSMFSEIGTIDGEHHVSNALTFDETIFVEILDQFSMRAAR
jgi:hypothetical protein